MSAAPDNIDHYSLDHVLDFYNGATRERRLSGLELDIGKRRIELQEEAEREVQRKEKKAKEESLRKKGCLAELFEYLVVVPLAMVAVAPAVPFILAKALDELAKPLYRARVKAARALTTPREVRERRQEHIGNIRVDPWGNENHPLEYATTPLAKMQERISQKTKGETFTLDEFYELTGTRRVVESLSRDRYGSLEHKTVKHARSNERLDLLLVLADRLGYFEGSAPLKAEARTAELRKYVSRKKESGETEDDLEFFLEDRDKLLAVARASFERGNFKKAITDYTKVLGTFADTQEAYVKIAEAHERMGDKDTAIEAYREVLYRFYNRFEDKGEMLALHEKLARLRYETGNFPSAGWYVRELEHLNRGHPVVKAFGNMKKDLYAKAVKAYGRLKAKRKGSQKRFFDLVNSAIELDPRQGDFIWLRALGYESIGETGKAQDDYIRLDNYDSFSSEHMKVSLWWDQRRKINAHRRSNALVKRPTRHNRREWAGSAHREMVAVERDGFEDPLLELRCVRTWLTEAEKSVGKKQFKQARAIYTRIVNIDPRNLEAHLGVASAWEATARRSKGEAKTKACDSAIARYKRILKTVHAQAVDAVYGIGKNYLTLGKYDSAAKRFQEALRIYPPHAEAVSGLQDIARHCYRRAIPLYNKVGQRKNAVALLDKAVSYDPQCSDVHRLRGMALEKLGKKSEAVASYRAALAPENCFWMKTGQKREADVRKRLAKLEK